MDGMEENGEDVNDLEGGELNRFVDAQADHMAMQGVVKPKP
jgi:hypothetical protein